MAPCLSYLAEVHIDLRDGQTDDLLTAYHLNVPEQLKSVKENQTFPILKGKNWINFKVLQNLFLKTIFTLADVLSGVRGLPCDTGDSRSCVGPVCQKKSQINFFSVQCASEKPPIHNIRKTVKLKF